MTFEIHPRGLAISRNSEGQFVTFSEGQFVTFKYTYTPGFVGRQWTEDEFWGIPGGLIPHQFHRYS